MSDTKRLNILWTNADPDTSQFMVMMYATNAMLYNWWDEIVVIVWGATTKLIAENETIQESIKIAQHAGVKFSACVACARRLGVVANLEAMDIELMPWGESLTEILKNDEKLLTV